MSRAGCFPSFWAAFRRAPPAPSRFFLPPPGTRLYAVGDIHGRLDLLQAMQELIAADAAASRTTRKILVYLGDYIDRGPDSCGVIDALTRPAPGFETVHLLGNHDQEMLAVLDGERDARHWLGFGGLTTLRSYGIDVSDLPPKAAGFRQLLADRVPAAHMALLRGLRTLHREGDFCFVHAGIRPGVPLESQDPEDLVWIREPFLDSPADHGCLVVHGHTIVRRPEVRPNRIGIDTGAYASNRLTCLVAEGDSLFFLNT